jgi:hypothetical protein
MPHSLVEGLVCSLPDSLFNSENVISIHTLVTVAERSKA